MDEMKFQASWSDAAKDGILLALFTILPTLLTAFVTNGVVSVLAWTVKTGGSLWLLYFLMKKWAVATGAPKAFNYGFKICLCSSVICAAWTYALFQYIVPGKQEEVINSLETALSGQTITDEIEQAILLLEDNFAQFNSISTLLGCVICGLIFSGIFSRSAAVSNVFSESEKEEDNDELL